MANACISLYLGVCISKGCAFLAAWSQHTDISDHERGRSLNHQKKPTVNPRYVVIHRELYPRRIEARMRRRVNLSTGRGEIESSSVSRRPLYPQVLHSAAQGTRRDAETCGCSSMTFEAPVSQ
jgi:hypothetical protein